MIGSVCARLSHGLVVLFCLFVSAPLTARDLPDFAGLAERQGAVVVNISTTHAIRQVRPGVPSLDEDDPMFDFFRRLVPRHPGLQRGPEPDNRSLGSGFIVSGDGYVLTNAHVVEGAEEIVVKLTDKREFRARVIGVDARTDLALLKIDASGLPRVSFGDPSKLRVGDWVVAIGSPFGFENSVTAGIVSAKGRSLPQENFVPFIQTDVAINPGNSGGPLFNLKGEVVGINSQIYSRTGGFMGLSFAIPIDVAMEVQEQLRANGRVHRGRIGVVIQEVSRELADSFKLVKPAGALVSSVEKGSPADKAGLEQGDIVLSFDGRPVGESADLPRLVGGTRPGNRVPVQVWRRGGTRVLTVAVAEMAEEKPRKPVARAPRPEPAAPNKLGIAVVEPNAEQRRDGRFAAGGVVVDALRSASARAAELQSGDGILALISKGVRTEIRSVEQFNRAVAGLDAGQIVTLLVARGDVQTFVPVRSLER